MRVREGLSDPASTRPGGIRPGREYAHCWGYDPGTAGWYRLAVEHCPSVAAAVRGRQRGAAGR